MTITLQIILDGDDVLESEKADLTRLLQDEILRLDVEIIDTSSIQNVPAGAKGGIDPVLLGAILIAAAPTVLPKLFDTLIAFMNRQIGQSIKIKIKADEIEIDVPSSMTPTEVKKWIKSLQNSLTKK